jgi:hypothetical protein
VQTGQNELELEKSSSDPNSVRVPGISADVEKDEAHRPEQGEYEGEDRGSMLTIE